MPGPTAYLHGNHDPCAACELRREMQDTAPIIRDEIPCNVCGGKGYLPLSSAEIVRRTVEEARRIYWPQVEARRRSIGNQSYQPQDAVQHFTKGGR